MLLDGIQEAFEEYQKFVEEQRTQYRERQEELKHRNKVEITISTKVYGYDDEFSSNKLTNTIVDNVETLGMTMTLIDHRDERSVFEDEEIVNTLEIRVTGAEKLTNVDISGVIPDCVTLKEYGENAVFDEKTRTLTYHFDELSNEKYINITVVMNKLAEDEYEKEFELKFKGTCAESEKTFESNTKSYYSINLAHGGFEISQTSDRTDGYVSIGENITYEITIKNNIKETAAMNIIDVLPEELEFVEAYYTQKEQKNSIPYSGGSEISAYVTLEPNEIAKMYVVGKAEPVATDTEITNVIKATDNKLNEYEGNSLKHIILASSTSVNPNDPNNPNRK